MHPKDRNGSKWPPWHRYLEMASESPAKRQVLDSIGMLQLIYDVEDMWNNAESDDAREAIVVFYRKQVRMIVPVTVGMKAAEGYLWHMAGASWYFVIGMPVLVAIAIFLSERR